MAIVETGIFQKMRGKLGNLVVYEVNGQKRLRTKPQEKEIPVEVPKERKDSIIYRNIEVEKIVPVERELTKWQKTQMKGFWVVLVVLVVYVFRKPFLALIRRFI